MRYVLIFSSTQQDTILKSQVCQAREREGRRVRYRFKLFQTENPLTIYLVLLLIRTSYVVRRTTINSNTISTRGQACKYHQLFIQTINPDIFQQIHLQLTRIILFGYDRIVQSIQILFYNSIMSLAGIGILILFQ